MWMVLVMLIIALALSGIFLWIKYSIKKSEEKKYYDAAARMIKENCLNKNHTKPWAEKADSDR